MPSKNFRIDRLDAATAEAEADHLLPIMGLVGPSIGTSEYLLATHKSDGTPLYRKWEHSLVLRRREEPIGLALAYERPATEGDPLYAKPELHLGILAVARDRQGRGGGSMLLRRLVGDAADEGFRSCWEEPLGHVGLAVHEDNTTAQALYDSFCFSIIGFEKRPEGTMYLRQATLPIIVANSKYLQTPVI